MDFAEIELKSKEMLPELLNFFINLTISILFYGWILSYGLNIDSKIANRIVSFIFIIALAIIPNAKLPFNLKIFKKKGV